MSLKHAKSAYPMTLRSLDIPFMQLEIFCFQQYSFEHVPSEYTYMKFKKKQQQQQQRLGASSSCPQSNEHHLVLILIPAHMCYEMTLFMLQE